jgi:hypothetical protein
MKKLIITAVLIVVIYIAVSPYVALVFDPFFAVSVRTSTAEKFSPLFISK